MGQNQSHVTFFYTELNIPFFRPHTVLQMVKTKSQYHVCVQSYCILNLVKQQISKSNVIVGATVSDFGLPWDLLAEIDFLI